MGFKQQLQEKLRTAKILPEELLNLVPKGFQDLNHRVILKLHPDLEEHAEEIASKIPEILPSVIAVWNRGQIKGKFRTPMGLTHLWGDTSTEVIITENNVRYKFDFTKIMFAKGNIHERNLLPQKIQSGEIIIDMFAGIGYFSLGMGKTGRAEHIYSIEWNPDAFKYLQENIKLNHIEEFITPYFGDCKELIVELVNKGILADRIVMGLLPAPVDAISYALRAIKPSGTIIVYEGVEPKESSSLYDEFENIANNLGFQCSLLERRIVKAFKPHEYHIVEEIFVKPME
ncbi:MAG: class I SAM-dependent methyltransferase [Promethearchaeota archaeon]